MPQNAGMEVSCMSKQLFALVHPAAAIKAERPQEVLVVMYEKVECEAEMERNGRKAGFPVAPELLCSCATCMAEHVQEVIDASLKIAKAKWQIVEKRGITSHENGFRYKGESRCGACRQYVYLDSSKKIATCGCGVQESNAYRISLKVFDLLWRAVCPICDSKMEAYGLSQFDADYEYFCHDCGYICFVKGEPDYNEAKAEAAQERKAETKSSE